MMYVFVHPSALLGLSCMLSPVCLVRVVFRLLLNCSIGAYLQHRSLSSVFFSVVLLGVLWIFQGYPLNPLLECLFNEITHPNKVSEVWVC